MSAISAIATSVPPGARNPAGNDIRLRRGLKLWRGRKGRHTAVAVAWGMLSVTSAVAAAQDMMRHVDLTSPEMTTAEMTRADVAASIAAATPAPVDFTGKKLSGLDLSGLDLSGAVLRAAKLNKTNLAGAKLDRAILDQAWLLEADLNQASLRGAHMFAAQMQGARPDGADLSGARSGRPDRCKPGWGLACWRRTAHTIKPPRVTPRSTQIW